MVNNKHISGIVIAITAVALAVCIAAMVCSGRIGEMAGGSGIKMEYEDKLFNTDEIISIDIKMDESDWDKMLESAMSEEYYTCDVVINGTTLYNVGIRPKGNTSLSSIASNPDTDRYSFKLEFGHFVDGQTCFGLDKLILNNNYADATNMKEAVIYDMFQYIGADASLYNYASISLNGEYKGVYLALEGVEESFMLRNFGTQDGELYKPDSMEMGGGKSDSSSGKSDKGISDMGDFKPGNMPDMGSFDGGNMPDMGNFSPGNMPDMGNFKPGDMKEKADGADASENESSAKEAAGSDDKEDKKPGGGGGFFMGGSGANLNYSDDELSSYSTIWDGALSDSNDADHKRVIKALKNISEGNELEKYLDVDNILKYMAVHVFSVNMDSLSGSMAHNYYLYEYKGQLNIFPWDYNLSLGGMSMGNSGSATDMVNDAIDTPFAGTKFFDALLSNEEYLEKYHEYLRMLTEEYVDGGRFDEVYSRIRSQIDELVKSDPTAFYSGDEYEAAAETLYKTVMLRARSIKGQLNGTIPSTDEGQKADSSALIDASDIDTDAMGQFNMGGVDKENAGLRRGGRTKGEKSQGGMQPPQFGGGGNGTPPGAPDGITDAAPDTAKYLTGGIYMGSMLLMLLFISFVKRKRYSK